jgi:hypothetical protein
MRRKLVFLRGAWVPLLWMDCGGGSGQPDAGMDATVEAGEDVFEASVDVAIDVPPERAIWVATPTTLFKFDPVTRIMQRVADFDCNGEPMVDLAMNVDEELFGITSESVVRIDKTTAFCEVIARGALDLPYATSFIPAGSLEAGVEQWLGYKYSEYESIDPEAGTLGFVGTLGPMGASVQASGDIVTIPGGATYMTAFNLNPMEGDLIVEVDPNTGALTQFDQATGETALVGLAQWAGILYIFSERGSVYRAQILGDAGINVQAIAITYDFGDAGMPEAGGDASTDAGDAAVEAAGPQPISWRGAAVTTRAPAQ